MDVRVLTVVLLVALFGGVESQNGRGCITSCFLKGGFYHLCGQCDKFVRCFGWAGMFYTVYDCRPGLVFDDNLKECVPSSATCTDPTLVSSVSQKPYVSFCECNGDPHCMQFDGKWVHFQGSCTYTMARDGCSNGVPTGDANFHVTTNNAKNNPRDNVNWVREIEVQLPKLGLTINVYQQRRVTINGEQMFGSRKSPHEDVEVIVTPAAAYIRVKDSVEVTYDGYSSVRVHIPEALKNVMCGICGNANDDSADDWVVGPSKLCMNKWPGAVEGTKTNDLNEFGYSWTHAIDQDESCVRECPTPPPPPGCTTVNHVKAQEHCDKLRNTGGPFGECLNAMPAEKRAMYFDNCVYDSCTLEIFDEVVCLHATDLAAYCHEEHDKTVAFRTADYCPLDCGAGMVYKACAKPCLPTCEDPDVCDSDDTPDGECEEGCFCEDGKVYNGVDACTSKDGCGCYVDEEEAFIPVGTSFMTQDCGETCACNSGSTDLECQLKGCGVNFACQIQSGIRGCYCDSPAQLINGECLSPKQICEQSKMAGSGSEKLKQYYYNSSKRKCVKFYYKGSGGNGNRFLSKDDCESFCDIFETPEHCKLPSDPGSGSGNGTPAYYYDMASKSCKSMKYLGSGGNANRFANKKKCSLACKE